VRREKLFLIVDRVGIVFVLVVASVLRSNFNYRTAFNDEALHLYGWWQLLNGQESYAMYHYIGWWVFSDIPLGIASSIGGLEGARALNAVWGVITVLAVMMIGRKVYGKIAGYIAAGIFAVDGLAIYYSTYAHYDSLSFLLVSAGIYLWVTAVSDNRDSLYALGSFIMTLAVLTKYTAGLVAVMCVTFGLAVGIREMVKNTAGESKNTSMFLNARIRRKLFLTIMPFLLLLLYAFIYMYPLIGVYNVVLDRHCDPCMRWEILEKYFDFLWLPFLLGMLSLFSRENRFLSTGLFVVGISLLPYHLLNRDSATLFKHTKD
jgi:4-amino-4-deoxy-L-arabinose transferase-like glycosyltransferase